MIGGGVRILLERGLTAHDIAVTTTELDALYSIYLGPLRGSYRRSFGDLSGALAGAGYPRGTRISLRRLHQQAGMAVRPAPGRARPFGPVRGHLRPGHVRHRQAEPGNAGANHPSCRRGPGPRADGWRLGHRHQYGAAAGIPVIAVDFGYTEVPVPLLSPDRVISHFDELIGAIDALLPAFDGKG
jgi:hypothetical protein